MKEILKNKSVLLISIFISIVLPVTYYKPAIDRVLMPRVFMLAVLIILLSIVWLTNKKKIHLGRKAASLIFLLFAYLLTSIISAFGAINGYESVFEIFKSALFVSFLFFVIISIQDDKFKLDLLIKSFIVFSFVIIAIALFQFFKVDFSDFRSHKKNLGYYFVLAITPVKSTMGNKNLFSDALFLCFPFLIYGIVYFNKFWRYLSIILIILSLGFIGMLVSKTVWVALGVSLFSALVLFIIYIIKNRKTIYASKQKYLIIILFSFVIVVILLFGYLHFTDNKILGVAKEKVEQIINKDNFDKELILNNDNPNVAQTRILAWYKSFKMFEEKPFFGVGQGNWRINIPKYGLNGFKTDIEQGVKHFQRAHNDYLWVLCETGIIGFIFYFSAFIFVLVLSIKKFFNAKNKNEKLLAFLLAITIVGYFTISFFTFPKERVPHNIIVFSFFAIIVSLFYKEEKIITINDKYRFIIIIFCLAIGTYSLFITKQKIYGERQTKKVIKDQYARRWVREIRDVDKIQGNYYSLDPYSTPIVWYKGVALSQMRKYAEAKVEYEKALKIHPYHIQVLNNLASCCDLLGDHNMAENYYKRALEISPDFKDALVNLSIVYFNKRENEKAYNTIYRCSGKNTVPQKYKIVLKAILKKKVDVIAKKAKNPLQRKKILELRNNDKRLIRLYNKSKRDNKIFEELVLEGLNF
ncbi:MAG: O-antigen ligase family protein [Bacteroidales bacterium]|nr:O-antigen ligase family protein [Bacteroidales bacterium]